MIFNFHGVGPVSRSMASGELNCWLDTRFFEAALDLLRDHSNAEITVDDGNVSDISHVLPALLARGLSGKFFICAGRLGDPSFVGRDQIRSLLADGMIIGSHGMGHRTWCGLLPQELDRELGSSRRTLEDTCGAPVEEAACPFGGYNRKVLAALRSAGYRRVYTSDGGASRNDSWIVPRTTVTRQMSLDEIGSLLINGPGAARQLLINTKRLCKRLR